MKLLKEGTGVIFVKNNEDGNGVIGDLGVIKFVDTQDPYLAYQVSKQTGKWVGLTLWVNIDEVEPIKGPARSWLWKFLFTGV